MRRQSSDPTIGGLIGLRRSGEIVIAGAGYRRHNHLVRHGNRAGPLAPPGADRLVTLITGDQVLVRDGAYTKLPAKGGSLTSYQTANGDRYFVPPEAMPYLSHGLDPALFDATAANGLAGNPDQLPDASYLCAHAAALNDVTGGNNSYGQDCGGDYECNAVPGYDGPTGLGTPEGVTAF